MTPYTFTAPPVINGDDLGTQIAASGLPKPAMVLLIGDSVQVNFDNPLSAAQQTSLRNTVSSHTPATLTVEQKLGRVGLKPKVLAAIVVRTSGAWAGLSNQEKNTIQGIIDDAAADLIAALRS